MIGYGAASTTFAGLAITMVIRRESGVLKRIRATPLPPAIYVVAVLVSTFVTFLIEAALIIVLGKVLFSVGFPDRPLSLLVTLAIGACAFAGLAITMTIRRESGVLKRIRATPLPPSTYLAAVLASTFVTFIVEAVLLIALGRVLFHVGLPDRPISLFVVLVIGAIAFAAMGLGLTGFVRSAEGSSAVVNFVYLPMAIISGTFFSPNKYPGFLKAIADVLPLTYFTKLTRDVMVRHHHVWAEKASIGVVILWGVIGLVAAIRAFRWQPREA